MWISEMLSKKTKRLLICFAAMYIFVAVLIIHVKQVSLENPYLDIFSAMWEGFVDIFKNPLRIFPLAPGTFGTIAYIYVLLTAVVVLIALNTNLRQHDDNAIGPDEWMTSLKEYNKRFTEPFGKESHDGKNNMIFSHEMFMAMDNKKIRRNMNICVIGGSGAGKSFNFVAPNLLQANCSYVVTDPSGGLYHDYAKFLEYMGYKIKCFNLSHMDKGNHYNPFRYIHNDKDIEILVTTLISNTNPPDKQGGDPFWEKSETALLVALIAYLHHYAYPSQQNFSNVMRMMRAAEISEEDSTQSSPLDAMFEQVEQLEPESFAVKQYKTFKMGAGKTLKSILISCAVRLQAFDLRDVAILTDSDDINLDAVGDEKTALFIITPTGEKTFNFLAALMYSQLFQRTYDYCENTAEFSQLVLDGENQLVRCYRANNLEQSRKRAQEAEEFLKRAKEARIVYRKDLEWYELVTKDNEMVTYRGSEEEAKKALRLIKEGGHVIPNSKQSNSGQRLPIHTRLMLDEFANIGKIPEFDQKVATIRKYEISVSIILQSLAQMKKMYKDDWADITGNCDTTIYLGGGADTETTEWISKLLGKETKVVMNISYGKGGGSTSLQKQGVELYSPAQLRTMPEDECIVIPKSLYAYKGLKYKSLDHPMWGLKESLGAYYFSEEKRQLLYATEEEYAEEDAPQVEEEHGEVTRDEELEQIRNAREQEARQQAREWDKNKDAEGERLATAPAPVIDKPAETHEDQEEELEFPDISSGFSDGFESPDASPKTSAPPNQQPPKSKPEKPDPSTWVKDEKDSSLDINDQSWGPQELFMGMAPADDTTSM